jgi:hypothetical protein
MSAGTTYFWRKDKLETLNYRVTTEDFNQSSMLKYLYCPCVIERFNFAQGRHWHGFFAETENFKAYWSPTAPAHLPEEFKLALLIMGVQHEG